MAINPYTMTGQIPGGTSPLAGLPSLRGTASGESRIDPTLRPYLELGLQRGEQLFFGAPQPTLYPGQMYVPPSQQTLTALQQQEALATAPQPTLQAAQQAYMGGLSGLGTTAAGSFLGRSPFQQQAIQAAVRPIQQQFEQTVLPGVASLYSQAGRYGSGAMERAVGQATEASGRAIGDVAASIAAQDYARERALQQQAQAQQISASQFAPQVFQQQFLPSQQLARIGEAREGIEALPLQEAIQRYQFEQQLPYQQLQSFLSSVYGTPLGSSQVPQVQVGTPSVNRVSTTLGGAVAGSQIGGLFNTGLFGLSPQTTGAVLGGLGGLLL